MIVEVAILCTNFCKQRIRLENVKDATQEHKKQIQVVVLALSSTAQVICK